MRNFVHSKLLLRPLKFLSRGPHVARQVFCVFLRYKNEKNTFQPNKTQQLNNLNLINVHPINKRIVKEAINII